MHLNPTNDSDRLSKESPILLPRWPIPQEYSTNADLPISKQQCTCSDIFWGGVAFSKEEVLLMEEILHQLIGSLSHYF